MDRNTLSPVSAPCEAVALRKESVDRNTNIMESSRAANVALRKESVDRNLYYGDDLTFADGRSPQGERG